MAFIRKDRVRETSSTTSTGNISLSGAVLGYRTFDSVCSVGDTFRYVVSLAGGDWETGYGTYLGSSQFERTLIIDGTNGTSAVNFGVGTKDVFIDLTAQGAATIADGLAFNGLQINGNVDVSQELTTTGATLATGTAKYIADMLQAQYVHGAGTAVLTSAQLAAASFPSALPGYSFGHQLKATTALSSPANGDYALHRTFIEGYRLARLAWGTASAQPLSYAFRFYSTASGTAFIKFSNSDKSRCYYKEITVAAGWNWFTGAILGDTSGTWQTTTSIGLQIEIFSAGKAASPATPGAWGTTNTTQTTNSTNLLGTNNNLTILTGLLILPGLELPSSERAALIMRPFDEEIIKCRRYWEQSVAPGSAVTVREGCEGASVHSTGATTVFAVYSKFKVPKRTDSAAVLIYAVQSGTANKIRDVSLSADRDGGVSEVNRNGFLGAITSGSIAVIGEYHYTANDRL